MSMPCPKCGKETGVRDTRWTPEPRGRTDSVQYIRRRRQCLSKKCDYRFSTVEYEAGIYNRSGRLTDKIEDRARAIVGKAMQELGKRFAKGEDV